MAPEDERTVVAGRLQDENVAACGTATEISGNFDSLRLANVFRTALRQLTRLGAASRLLSRPSGSGGQNEISTFSADPDVDLPVVPSDRRSATLQMVTAALQQDGVQYRSRVTASNAYCAVLAQDLKAVCDTLNRLARTSGHPGVRIWCGRGMDYDRYIDATSLQFADAMRCDSLVVGVPFECHSLHVSREGGVEILILDQHGARRLARRKRAAVVDWTSQFETADGSDHSKTVRHALEGEAVDVVYTWVDADDPAWAKSMREWANRQDTVLESADNEQRYACRDELRYSLRSLWLYAPFVRRIFLVTVGHTPDWLDRGNEKIQVIRHEDIFPDPDCLPTFNSHAIESCLHRIPDLSENFIYFNDDVFLNRETTIDTFFTRMGLVKSRFSEVASVPVAQPDASSTPTDWATWQSADVIARDFGIRFDRKLKHVPMAMKRSVLGEIESRYAEQIDRTRRARFRAESDIATSNALAHFYGISTGKAVDWAHIPGEYCYVDTGRGDFESKLGEVTAVDPVFYCLNATRHSDVPSEQQQKVLSAFLEARYPLTSPFEKSFDHVMDTQ